MCNLAVLRPGFIFGLLPGWWLGTEDNREWGPLLSEKDWHEVLTRHGFSGTDVIIRDNQSEPVHLHSAIISTAVEQTNNHTPSHLLEVLIFAAQDSTQQHNAANQIQSRLLSPGISGCDVIDPHAISSTIVAKKHCISLLELESSFLSSLEADQYANLKKVVTSANALLWITGGGGEWTETLELSLVTGFSRSIRSEYSNLNFVTLALENTIRDASSLVQPIVKVFETTMLSDQGTTEKEYVERNGVICVGRIVEAGYLNDSVFSKEVSPEAEARKFKEDPIRPLTLAIGSPGLLNTIQFVTDDIYDQPLQPEDVEVVIKASGLVFYDIPRLLDQASSEPVGTECTGVVTRLGTSVKGNVKVGDRVCCMPRGSYKTYARCNGSLVATIPDDLPFTSGAAIPIAYCTAYHSLHDLGLLQADTSILIHCGAGSVGQAAIQLARLIAKTSNIFVTVGTNEKKRLIMDRYAILEDHIFSSRSSSFADGVERMTQGRGIDLVLNSLRGEKLRRSLDCVAPFGRFIDIGLADVDSFRTLPALPFSKSITFASVDMGLMIREAPNVLGGVLGKVMALLRTNKIAPEASHVYSYSKLEDAFRLLQGGKNLGKVVAVPHETDLVPVSTSLDSEHDNDRPTNQSVRDSRSYQTKNPRITLTMVLLT